MRVPANTKPLFTTGSTLNVKLALCVCASLVVLAIDGRSVTTAQRLPFEAMVTPLRQAVSGPSQFLFRMAELARTQTALVAENERLQQEALVLKGKQLKFEALEKENIRLRGLLDSTFKVGDQVLIAEPLAINVFPHENLIVVNKGSRYGIRVGQAVVDGNGVVGQVLRVSANHADVVMITDPSHAIPVQVNRNGLRTIALGTGRADRLELPYLSGNADIRPGDLLVTSGLGGAFPAGYPVARVAAPPADQSSAGRYLAVPVAQLDRNRELLVVRSDSTPLPRIPDQTDALAQSTSSHDVR